MQIIRKDTKTKDGKDVFVEFVTNGFSIDKVQLNFSRIGLDNKQEIFRQFWIDINKAIVLFNEILDGTMMKAMTSDTTPNKKFFDDLGGTTFHRVGNANYFDNVKFTKMKNDYPWLENSKELSRSVFITKGNKYPYILNAVCQLGHLDGKNGLIVPEGNVPFGEQFYIPLTENDMKQIAASVLMEIQAFKNARSVEFFKTMYPSAKDPSYIKDQTN